MRDQRDPDELLSAKQVALELGITTKTLNFWYMYERRCTEEELRGKVRLPQYTQMYDRGERLWRYSQIKQLKKWQNSIQRGRHGFMRKVLNYHQPKTEDAK